MLARLLIACCAAALLAQAGHAASLGTAPPSAQTFMLAQNDAPRDTEARLRKVIGELAQSTPDYAGMEPPLRQVMLQQVQATAALLQRLGALERIELDGNQGGTDLYRVTFRNGATLWGIRLAADGKIAALFIRLIPAAEAVGEEAVTAGLSGTLVKPPGVERPPVVLLIAGSGPTDRNGNQDGKGPGQLRQLAEVLAGRGIASLRYDKRAVGRSLIGSRREEDIDLDAFISDAGAWLEWLSQRPDLGPTIIAGHSEGGVIAIRLAGRSAPAGIILLSTPGRPLATVIRDQIEAIGLPQPLHDEAIATLAALERGESVATVSPPLMPLFRPSVQPFLRSEFAVDPARDLAALKTPVLIVSGGHDLQVREADAAALARARPDAVRFHLADMNHVLKITPAGRAEQQPAYTDPAIPLAPGLVDAIVAFVLR